MNELWQEYSVMVLAKAKIATTARMFVDIAATLQAGLKAIRARDLSLAENYLVGILRYETTQADALQLMGIVRKAQGRFEEAQTFLRQSLIAQPNQPHVLNNLANLLVVDTPYKAAALYQEAITLQPNYPDAIANLAGIYQAKGQQDEAKSYYQNALGFNQNHIQSILGLASLYLELGNNHDAGDMAARAIVLAPKNVRAHTLLGDIFLAQSDFANAVKAYRQALAIGPETGDLWVALGSALRCNLQDQEAFSAFARALQLSPGNVIAHRNLNGLLWNYGRSENYLGSYRTMLPLVPDDVTVRVAFAEDLLRHGEVNEAEAVIAEAASQTVLPTELFQIRGRIAIAQGDFDNAIAMFTNAIVDKPNDSSPYICKLDAMLKAHRFDQAADFANQVLPQFSNDQDILARLVAAQRLSGNLAEGGLWDTTQYVSAIDLFPPDGRTIEDFNAELAQHLRTLHVTTVHPVDQTLRGGTQTFGNLFSSDKSEIVQTLVIMLRQAITSYSAQLPIDLKNPVSRRRTDDFDFAGSWSARLLANGFHTNHIHPMGWLSSAYYVALPAQSQDQNQKAGWFTLGQTNMNLGKHDIPLHLIEPRVGRLILFPSYYWHGTTPFNDVGERLTIAFDVVPK